jgi:hypothetical protein
VGEIPLVVVVVPGVATVFTEVVGLLGTARCVPSNDLAAAGLVFADELAAAKFTGVFQ